MTSRREFHKRLACTVGSTIASTRFAGRTTASPSSDNGRRVVTIFLRGGNDGLNTVVPVHDPLYVSSRDDLRIRPEEAITLNDRLSMNSAMRSLTRCWEAGRMRIQQGVGDPNHSHSHFLSTAVWSEGKLDATLPSFDGWLGRALDPLQPTTRTPLACAIDSPDTPELLRSRLTRTCSVPELPRDQAQTLLKLMRSNPDLTGESEIQRHVLQACRDAATSLENSTRSSTRIRGFPRTPFGERMRQAANVVTTLPEIKAIHAVHDGYDTHTAQRGQHNALQRELADGLAALDRFLAERGLSESTLVMVFSEFGRRVKENASHGTDHGSAGPVFFLGGETPPGLYGSSPDLENLDDGDVAVTQDFRVLQKAIARWLVARDGQLGLPD
ncbi:DUF1501 domain-containing protein [Roseiconus nitratireducens]|uniref:DUF1501 domain-containing protein n=1 Tax=Roseiconus nitratireducens TaxID=2605748 RepID=A0A5M6CRZ5_9BACT|nr:DUF1501 domain-containing protein [Roseiconus nitratireducens]KAA5537967.1 DUF1501 domain-containing protein [Roseiconus nitratireducens]